MIEAVIFDFDGVLVHSEPLHLLAFQQAAREIDVDLTNEEYYRDLIGFDDRGAFKAMLATRQRVVKPAVLLNLLARKRELARKLIEENHYHPLPGVEELVRGLWRVYPLAICSGALREEIELMLEGIRLRDCFRVIVSAEDVKIGKPDPSGYVKALAELSVLHDTTFAPSDCLIFEDAPRVIDRVKPLGFATVGVASATMPAARLASADAVVHSLEPPEVLAKVKGLKIYE